MSAYQVLILAAGKGVRMRSCLPKVLHRVSGVTLLERVIRASLAVKPAQITVVVGHGAALVETELKRLSLGVPIVTVTQTEQRGTGHAVQVALGKLHTGTERVIVIPGDVPLLRPETLLEITSGDAGLRYPEMLVVSCEPPSPAGYGRIIRSAEGGILRIVEEKDCTAQEREIGEINSSIYCGTLSFLKEFLPKLKPNNAQGELYLTDTVQLGIESLKTIRAFVIDDAFDVAGANNRAELSVLEAIQRGRINRRWMEAGVTLEDAAASYIDEDVTFGEDVFVGAGCHFRGKTQVGSGVEFHGESWIDSSRIGDGTTVRVNCSIEGSEIGRNCVIGPFAHTRPGTKLHDDVHIGNFVETKQAELQAGAKANHLSYIGDATVGEKANVGAGTITCNYDGVKKHRTVIGRGAFIGSNTSLVAPVTVGEDAVTGAGSVITKEVPAGALALERSEQRNIADYRTRKKVKS